MEFLSQMCFSLFFLFISYLNCNIGWTDLPAERSNTPICGQSLGHEHAQHCPLGSPVPSVAFAAVCCGVYPLVTLSE